jgi:hypothetical protein
MQLVFGHDATIGAWAAERLGLTINPPFVALGIVDASGDLKGALIYHNWNGSDLEVTHYGPNCWTRSVVRAALWAYPFENVGANRLTARTRRTNRNVRQLLTRLGFVNEAVLKRYYGPARGDDAFVFRLDRAKAERWR